MVLASKHASGFILLALLISTAASRATPGDVARVACQPHMAVRFELAEFASQLAPCAGVKDDLVAEARRVLERHGIRIADKSERSLPMLQLRVVGYIGDGGVGSYSVDLRLHEDLDHLVNGQKCLADVVTWSTHPNVDRIEAGRCGELTRIVSVSVDAFAGGSGHDTW